MEIIKVKGFDNIYSVSCFEDEFYSEVSEKRSKPGRYTNWLQNSLAVLDELGPNAPRSKFEQLNTKQKTKLYSIRYPKSKKNPRVIYYFITGKKAVLLTAFLERDSSDYDKAINLAYSRIKLLNSEVNL